MSGRESNLRLPGTLVLLSDYIKSSFLLLIQQLCVRSQRHRRGHYKAMLLISPLKLLHGHSVISEKPLEVDARWTLVTFNRSLRDKSGSQQENAGWLEKESKSTGYFFCSFILQALKNKTQTCSYSILSTVLCRGETARFYLLNLMTWSPAWPPCVVRQFCVLEKKYVQRRIPLTRNCWRGQKWKEEKAEVRFFFFQRVSLIQQNGLRGHVTNSLSEHL